MIKPIPNFPGYFADTDGNIWTGIKIGRRTRTNTGAPIRKLKPGLDNYGYLIVRLYYEKKPRTRTVHQLILETFIGPRPSGMECCHKKGIKLDNRLSQLRWDTRSNNAKDRFKHGTMPNQKGEKNNHATLNSSQVIEIKRLLKEKQLNQREISEMFNVTQATISCIKTGKTWTHI
jgi:predicted XRE-type DNA-binding protein